MNTARHTERKPLTDEQKQQMTGMIVLDRMAEEPTAFHAGLLTDKQDRFLEPVFRYLQQQDLVEVNKEDYFAPTKKGQAAYAKLVEQRKSYLAHFEIFSMVDLGEGIFGDMEDLEYGEGANDHWEDLRLAVAEYKGIDPYRMVFLAMLADGAFFDNPDWKYDLALDSNFFKELEDIVKSQITIEELGYVTEDGEEISGEKVIEDVILQGAKVNRERYEREKANMGQQELLAQQELQAQQTQAAESGQGGTTVVFYEPYYDPYPTMALYAGTALFVEAVWLSTLW